MFTRDQAAHYLGAMIDGEGWVGEPKGVQNRAIRIANTDPALIDAIVECCQVLGLHYTFTHHRPQQTHWSPQTQVHISGQESFRIVAAEVPVRAPKKRDRIERTIASFKRELWDMDEVERLYQSGLTQREVADALGRNISGLRKAMRRHGIVGRSGAERAHAGWRSRRA